MISKSRLPKISINREASNISINQRNADVQNALGTQRARSAYLQRDEVGGRGGAERAEERAGRAEQRVGGEEVVAGAGGVDVDVDGGGVGAEGGVVDAEDELVVPGGVGVAGAVEAGADAVGGEEPGGGVGAHGAGRGVEVLGRYEGDFEEVEVEGERRRGGVVPAAAIR